MPRYRPRSQPDGRRPKIFRANRALPALAWTKELPIGKIDFSPSGRWLAVAQTDTIQLWEVASGQKIGELRADHAIETLKFAPDDRTLVSGGDDCTILVWDLTDQDKRKKE